MNNKPKVYFYHFLYTRKHVKQLTYIPSVNPNNNQIRVAVILFDRWRSKS